MILWFLCLCLCALIVEARDSSLEYVKLVWLMMEGKNNKASNTFVFAVTSLNAILTLSTLGFTCYSLQRLESRVSRIERVVLEEDHHNRRPMTFYNPTRTSTSHGARDKAEKKAALVKRAAKSPCEKCSTTCSKWNSNLYVSRLI